MEDPKWAILVEAVEIHAGSILTSNLSAGETEALDIRAAGGHCQAVEGHRRGVEGQRRDIEGHRRDIEGQQWAAGGGHRAVKAGHGCDEKFVKGQRRLLT